MHRERAGDAVMKLVSNHSCRGENTEDKGRIMDEWTLRKRSGDRMKGELDNIRAWGTYLSTIKYKLRCIMGALSSGR
jgi:hypothetical protein